MKASSLIAAIREHNQRTTALLLKKQPMPAERIQHILVHSGQHYDEAMSGTFFVDLDLPKPDVYLGVGSGSHAAQTAQIMLRFEEVLLQEKPDAILVVGDVNSTLACALVTAKISFDARGTRPLIAHVEAGLRSFDRTMPEEVNRILTDHISDLLFVTEESGIRNLHREGIANEKTHFVGNTMIDSLLKFKDKAETSDILDKLGLRNGADDPESTNGVMRYALLTLHRPSNVDQRDTFSNILEGIEHLSDSCPIIFPVHPRTRKRIAEFGLEHFSRSENGNVRQSDSHTGTVGAGIHLVDPLGYLDFLQLMKHATVVVTDSGGIQEETTCLGVPCVTVRENTERPVTVTCGTNTIAGTQRDTIRQAVESQARRTPCGRVPEKWDGRAGSRIVDVLAAEVRRRTNSMILVT